MGYIGAHGAAALHRYKYSGEDHSYLAKYLLDPFWTHFTKHDNAYGVYVSSHIFPARIHIFTSVGFSYSTMGALRTRFAPILTFDAVDEKQARRTNSSSPLGELFDHGLQAMFVNSQGVPRTWT
ncbi:unnamed protein product [Brassica oleracea]